MSSRRKLKKYINSTMEQLYADCLLYKVYVVDADPEAADKVIAGITVKHDELLKRLSSSEGKNVKGRVKAYYKKLKADFIEQTNVIAKEIASLP